MQTRAVLPLAWLVTLLLFIAWSDSAWAGEDQVVQIQEVASISAHAQGASYLLGFRLVIAPGFHINSTRPGDGLMPTRLTHLASAGLKITGLSYPRAELHQLDAFDQPFPTYSGEVIIKARLEVARNTPPGVYPIQVQVHYQACNDRLCLMPQVATHSFRVTVSPAGKPGKALNQDIFARSKH